MTDRMKRGAISVQLRLLLDRLGLEARSESVALLTGGVFLVVGFLVALVNFWGDRPSIIGLGSVGTFASIGSAVVAAVTLILGRLFVRRAHLGGEPMQNRLVLPGDRLRWYDIASITAAYAAIPLLGWQGIASLVAQSFRGAPVYPFPAAVLVGVAFGVTAYIVFLSAVALDPMTLSIVMAIFLVVGAFASMLLATDPHWWRNNLSALGMVRNESSWVFNSTLIIAGVITTTIARYATVHLPSVLPSDRRGRRNVRLGLVLLGILLAGVGALPWDVFPIAHVVVSILMVVVFVTVVVALPWWVRSLPTVFFVFGYFYVGVLVVLGVLYGTDYYNLTAVELVAAIIVFSWIIVFLRTAGDPSVPDDAAEALASDDAASFATRGAPVAEESARNRHEHD